MWRKCGGKRDCVKIAKNDFGKCMFEDPYKMTVPTYLDIVGVIEKGFAT
jgi:hypothetical protein